MCCRDDMKLIFFFVNDTATTEIYTYLHTLSLHDALPISTITSKSSNVCAWTLSRVDSICFPLLNKGMITENRGEPDIWLAGRGQFTYRAARQRTPLWQGYLKNFLTALLLTLAQLEFSVSVCWFSDGLPSPPGQSLTSPLFIHLPLPL